MPRSKSVPLVNDFDFGIRTPGFIAIHGYVLHLMAVNFRNQRIMRAGEVVSYNRHGSFRVCCVHGDHAVIEHTTLSGKVMPIIVPSRQWLNVSNGSYQANSPHYQSFEDLYSWLRYRIPA